MEESCSSSSDRRKYKKRLQEEDDREGSKKRFKADNSQSSSKSKVYQCPLCEYDTENNKLMSQHLDRNHKGAQIPGGEKKLTAKYCIVEDADEIEKLKQKPEKSYPFPCTKPNCRKGYESKRGLQAHLNLAHSEQYKFCCVVCGRMEYEAIVMRLHYKNNHANFNYDIRQCEALMKTIYEDSEKSGNPPQQPSYSCLACDKVFEFTNLLKNHSKSHDLESRTCKKCWRIFNTRVACETHQTSHDPALKRFVCMTDGCESKFATVWKLQDHQQYASVHNPDQKFQCEKCKRKFQWPRDFANHQKIPCPPLKNDALYRCSTCKRPYYQKKSLDKHEQRHADGILNLQVPPDHMIRIYRKMINTCNEMIHIDRCNTNKGKDKAQCHIILLPCSHVSDDGAKCSMKAVMFTSAPTPWHHLKNLLFSMIKGRACTSLHSHCEGEGHIFDLAEAKFVDGGDGPYEMQVVKKMIVKMAKKEDTIRVTNHTEYEVYHLYNDSALNEIIRIMRDEELTSKSDDVLLADMQEHLEGILNHGETVRRHGELIFEDNMFKFAKREEDDSCSDIDDELDDEDINWEQESFDDDDED